MAFNHHCDIHGDHSTAETAAKCIELRTAAGYYSEAAKAASVAGVTKPEPTVTVTVTVKHFPSCRADYPEKPIGEPAQMLVSEDIGDGETVWVCVDCGAFAVTEVGNEAA